MKKTIYLITTILLSLSLSTKVEAYCSQEEINAFKKIENKINATFTYDENTATYSFIFYFPNMTDYVFRFENMKRSDLNHCQFTSINEYRCTGKDFEDNITYIIKRETNTCNEELKRATVTLKKKISYNAFSESELCNGIEEFVLCQKDYDIEITQEEFESRVELYKNNLEEKENEEDNKEKTENIENEKENWVKKFFNNLIKFINDNIILVIVIIIFIILLIVYSVLLTRKIKRSRRLE